MRRSVPSWAKGGVGEGGGLSSSGVTTVAASASESPRRWAKAVGERAGASPRVRNAASSAGRDVNPLIGFALAHAEQASLDDLQRVG